MSDTPEGPGWWMADDGRWYPPHLRAGTSTTPPPSPASPPDSATTETPTPLAPTAVQFDPKLEQGGVGRVIAISVLSVLVLVAAVAIAVLIVTDKHDDNTPGGSSADKGATSTTTASVPESTAVPSTVPAFTPSDQPAEVVQTFALPPAPAMPASVAGYRASGPLQSTTVRVFEGVEFAASEAGGDSMNSCAQGFWTARWRTFSSEVTVKAILGPYDAGYVTYELSADFATATAGSAGYMSGFACAKAVFSFGADTTQSGSGLVDVTIDWQWWDIAP